MGLLFTYMIKAAAAEQQPAPYTGYYGAWGSKDQDEGLSGVYELPSSFWAGSVRDRNKAIDRLFSASQNVDSWNALAGNDNTNWGTDYLTAVDKRFISPEAIYDVLSKNPAYLEAIRHLANTGSYDKLDKLTDFVNSTNNPGLDHVRRKNGLGIHRGTAYDLAGGVGNAQLVINNYLAVEAQRKAAEDAARKKAEESTPQVQAPAAPVTAPVKAPVTNPQQPQVQQPATPATSSFYKLLGPLAAVAPKAAQSGYEKYLAPPAGSLIDKVQKNIAAGRSMYDGMTAATPGMTAGQRQALTTRGFVGDKQQQAAALAAAQENAAKNGMTLPNSEYDAYTGAGLRLVGHSADGRTRTYVGKSGRGRITVGDDAGAGHYRGVGNMDTDVQSNYADIRRPNTQRPPAPASRPEKGTTPPNSRPVTPPQINSPVTSKTPNR